LTDFVGNFRGYYKDKNHIYNCYSKNGQNSINNSDSATFQIIDDDFAKDKNNVYYDSRTMGGYKFSIVENVDPGTVEALNSNIIKDKGGVYYIYHERMEVIEEANPNSFSVIDDSSYGKDEDNVFYTSFSVVKMDEVKIIDGADPDTFEILKAPYSKDSNNVFYSFISVKDVDVDTFEALGLSYAKDEDGVYYCKEINPVNINCFVVEGADTNTFEILMGSDDNHYIGAKDKNYIYSDGRLIHNSDSSTFEVTSTFNARDKNNSYLISCGMDGCYIEVND